jgi:hypothetical protein
MTEASRTECAQCDITISTRFTRKLPSRNQHQPDLRWQLELFFPPPKENDAPIANTTWCGRSDFLWGGRAYGSRRGPGARTLQANQDGLSERRFRPGCSPGRRWATDPLHHAHHAGEDSAAYRTQAIAESRSANSRRLQSKECEIWAAAGIPVGRVAATVAG